jgi:NADPH:quinone reductase-like Zn-dependent oxidoreductase
VTRFREGDKVVTLFSQGHLAGSIDQHTMAAGLGGARDGCLRQYGAFDEQNLVKAPSNLSMIAASSLPCAALTAWSALYGLESKALKPGDTVLTQGTGGVSLFAVQFAKAAGAKVVSTTSSKEKADLLKQYGADVVINYKEVAEWGSAAKEHTPNREGFSHIVEVGGPTTMKQSLNAIKLDGVISVIGFLGGPAAGEEPSILEVLNHACTIRGVFVGSRLQFEDMIRAVETNGIEPVMDKRVFGLDDVKEAYQYLWDRENFGKVSISIE